MAEGLLCCTAPEPDCTQCAHLVASGSCRRGFTSDGNLSDSSEGCEACMEDVLEFGVEAITPPRQPHRQLPLEASMGLSSLNCQNGLAGLHLAHGSGSFVPWANLKGPSSWSGASLPSIKANQQAEVVDPALRGVAVSARTSPVAKTNPCSKLLDSEFFG